MILVGAAVCCLASVTMLGDSVTHLADAELTAAISEVTPGTADVTGHPGVNVNFGMTLNRFESGKTVVVALGTNDLPFIRNETDAVYRMLDAARYIPAGSRWLWVTPFAVNTIDGAAIFRAALFKHADAFGFDVIDWYALANRNRGWFPDGTHPNQAGQDAFAELVASEFTLATRGPQRRVG